MENNFFKLHTYLYNFPQKLNYFGVQNFDLIRYMYLRIQISDIHFNFD